MLKSNDVISVAWGKTVLAAAQAIPHNQLDNLTVVQVVGVFHSAVRSFLQSFVHPYLLTALTPAA